jgi:hypothetical protein
VATVDALSTIALLMAIVLMYPGKRLIHVFLDNARYHHARLVQEWRARSSLRPMSIVDCLGSKNVIDTTLACLIRCNFPGCDPHFRRANGWRSGPGSAGTHEPFAQMGA